MADHLLPRLRHLGVFADLTEPELHALSVELEERSFPEGSWVLRQGGQAASLFVIIDGAVGVVIDDEERAKLATGSFFGEVSALLGEPSTADIVARTPLRCLVIPADRTQEFLLAHPRVMYRMLQTEARRLKTVDPMRSLYRHVLSHLTGCQSVGNAVRLPSDRRARHNRGPPLGGSGWHRRHHRLVLLPEL